MLIIIKNNFRGYYIYIDMQKCNFLRQFLCKCSSKFVLKYELHISLRLTPRCCIQRLISKRFSGYSGWLSEYVHSVSINRSVCMSVN